MTGNEYQKLALRTAQTDVFTKPALLMNGALGLNGEAGEVADIVKKHNFQGHELDKKHLAEELGDVCWYVALAAYAIGYDLDDIMQGNVDKLRKRYPRGFEADRSIHREV